MMVHMDKRGYIYFVFLVHYKHLWESCVRGGLPSVYLPSRGSQVEVEWLRSTGGEDVPFTLDKRCVSSFGAQAHCCLYECVGEHPSPYFLYLR